MVPFELGSVAVIAASHWRANRKSLKRAAKEASNDKRTDDQRPNAERPIGERQNGKSPGEKPQPFYTEPRVRLLF